MGNNIWKLKAQRLEIENCLYHAIKNNDPTKIIKYRFELEEIDELIMKEVLGLS